jgi:small subunit ribosomal protein S11
MENEEVKNTEATITEVAAVAKKKKASDKIVTAKGKKRTLQNVPQGRVYVHASYNNTIIAFTDMNGNVIAWSSAGNCGFKGPKKATPYAASIVVKKATEKIAPYGMKDIHVFVTGIGQGRDGAIKALNGNAFNVLSITDTTPVSHNGCRPKRARRI